MRIKETWEDRFDVKFKCSIRQFGLEALIKDFIRKELVIKAETGRKVKVQRYTLCQEGDIVAEKEGNILFFDDIPTDWQEMINRGNNGKD